MIQANPAVNDLLSALTATGNAPLPGLTKDGIVTGEKGLNFLSLLNGLTGMKSSGEGDIFGTDSELGSEDMDFIAAMLAGDQIAQARPLFIPLNNGNTSEDPSPMGESEMKESFLTTGILSGSDQYPQMADALVKSEEAAGIDPGDDPASGFKSLKLNGMDGRVAGFTQIPLSADVSIADGTVEQSDGSRAKPLDGFLQVSELEELMPGEKLSLTFVDDKTGEIETAEFTKTNQSESFNGKEFTRFEIELQGEGKSTKLNAVLASSPAKGEKTVGDLIKIAEAHKSSEAKLMVVVPQETAPEQDLTSKEKNPVMKMDQILSGRFIIDDAASQQRQIQLRDAGLQINGTQSKDGLPSQEEGSYKVIIGSDGKSDANQGSLNQNANHNSMNYSAMEFANAARNSSESISEKIGALQFSLTQNQEALPVEEKAEVGNTVQTKDAGQFRNIFFKLEPPMGGTKIPEGGYFRIKLEPEELGKIDVELKLDHNKMVARMKVDTPLARQVVESHLPQLRETLHSHGIKVENIIVDLNNNAGDFNQNLNGQQAQNQLANRIRFNQNMDLTQEDIGLDSDFTPSNRILNLRGNLSLLA